MCGVYGNHQPMRSVRGARNPPRKPTTPFDVFSPAGRKHYEVTFSTGTPYKCAPPRPELAAKLSQAQLEKEVWSRLAVCDFEAGRRPSFAPPTVATVGRMPDAHAYLNDNWYDVLSNAAFGRAFYSLAKDYANAFPSAPATRVVARARAFHEQARRVKRAFDNVMQALGVSQQVARKLF